MSKKLRLYIVAFVFTTTGIVCAFIVRKFVLVATNHEEFSEFYREIWMTRTHQLEKNQEIQRAFVEMKKVNLCGLLYNLRVSQTSSDVRMGLTCDQKKWIRLNLALAGSVQQPFSPFGVQKFAILQRDGQFIVVTQGSNGQNTFDELAIGIPKVLHAAIEVFPQVDAAERLAMEKSKNKEVEADIRRDEIKKSFE